MRIIVAILALVLIPNAGAATYTAASASWTDVSNALASCASYGDTVRIPTGGANWTNTLLVPKGVQFLGAGTNSTFLTNRIWPAVSPFNSGTLRPTLFWVTFTNDWLVRFSGITAELSRDPANTNSGAYTNSNSFLYVDPAVRNTNTVLTQVIVDNCLLKNAFSRTIYTDGDVYGVISSNVFENCFLLVEPTARHDVGWFRPWNTEPLLALGTTNTLVMEGNLIVYNQLTETWDAGPNITASGQGASYVFRNNTVTNTANPRIFGHDFHGNNYNWYSNKWRGTRFVEIYGNRYYSPKGNKGTDFIDGARGGCAMIFSNLVVWNTYTNNLWDNIDIWEEEYWRAYTYDTNVPPTIVRTVPPAQDQITNSYIFENWTSSGQPCSIGIHDPSEAVGLSVNIDWFTNAPWATNLYSFTNRGGGVNVMAAYRPLAYPHPLLSTLNNASAAVAALNAATANIGQLIYVGP